MKKLANEMAKNPLLVLFLGACPAMAATASVLGGVGMGLAVLVVLVLTGLVISALRKFISAEAVIPACVIVSAGFASMVQMLMSALLPNIAQMLGVYVAVVAVNLVVFARAEGAVEESVGTAVTNALLTGVWFTVVLAVMGLVREVLGSGSVAGVELAFLANYRIPLLAKAPGGFMVASIVAAVLSKLSGSCEEADTCKAGAAAGMCECCCTCEDKEVQE